VRQRSISADLIFCFFFIKKKEEGLRGLGGARRVRYGLFKRHAKRVKTRKG